ncbi:hypothetical protein AA0Y32_14600 [Georgenia phoenicis]|uniref:hypothetical protein n=1 Tax=unclassified Georgenia TaxID=2626815 RepID=UPI0039B06F95
MPITVTVTDPLPGARTCEPIIFSVPEALSGDVWKATAADGNEVICQRLATRSDSTRTTFAATVTFEGSTTLTLDGPLADPASAPGIVELPARETDAFVRLDTGCFDLELCRGTAQGEGSSKWGLRHFAATADGVDLLPSGNNAIGGFYGPFFTPENGLINPPEHTTVEIEVVERGPVLHHYRMHGTVPDGLLPELRGKRFAIDWVFTYGTPFFQRKYDVEDFRTVINGRSVTNKITVGDEFEGGAGELVFDRFDTAGGTRYRAGDPYAHQLVDMVSETVRDSTATSDTFARFREQLTGDLESAHWDLYWRLFCVWEKALDDDEIRDRLARVRSASHVLADDVDRPWIISDDPVDVSSASHETIFPGAASKTAEYHSGTGRTMVWWTSVPSGAFQIVQRRQSGWVNWGSNSENECPELPVGADIKTGWRPAPDGWTAFADQLETSPEVAVVEEPARG